MALTKQQKADILEDLTGLLENAQTVYVADYAGLDVAQSSELRNRFRQRDVQFRVVKNTLLRLAMDRVGGFENLYEYLEGPTAIALSSEPAAPARVIKDYLKDSRGEKPALKAAFVDGSVYDGAQLDALAALKSRDELIGDILVLLSSPPRNVVAAVQGVGARLAGVVKVLAERESA
jgi:large subunit ribosomal protein L10